MKKITNEEGDWIVIEDIDVIHKLLLIILVEFHEICEKNHLVYNLFAGTHLGAIRHKGFIPWDDDVDVCMPRDDYQKFIKLTREYQSEKFVCFYPGDDNYASPYVKMCLKNTKVRWKMALSQYNEIYGIFIDIFPVDGTSASDEVEKSRLKTFQILEGKISYATTTSKVYDKTGWRKVLKSIDPWRHLKYGYYHARGFRKYLAHFIKLAEEYDVKKSDYLDVYYSSYNNRISRVDFYDRVLCNFENHRFYVVRNSDSWLSRQYGDFMVPKKPEAGGGGDHWCDFIVHKNVLKSMGFDNMYM